MIDDISKNNPRFDAEKVWGDCLGFLKQKSQPQTFKTWFEPMRAVWFEKNELVIHVPSQFFYEWVDSHYLPVLKEALKNSSVSGAHFKFVISAQEDFEGDALQSSSSGIVVEKNEKSGGTASTTTTPSLSPFVSFLNPRYVFENFIKGESNQLARAAASAVANNPGGTSFNPLVIYGETGLGKTHLIQAIGHEAIKNKKANRVVYISSEKFTVEFVDAIQQDRLKEFSGFYRSMDILIVDDIQFFSGKEKTQDNFFHTFNVLHQLGKQIILSSDRPPKDLKGLDERLVSRFQWGLIADIQPPDLETRVAILNKKCKDDKIDFPQEVVEYIAANVTTNIRELEGSFISMLAKSSLENKEINIELAKEVLSSIVSDVRRLVNIENIQKIVSEHFDIPVDLLKSKTRKQEIVNARMIAMYLSKELTRCSLKTIGLHFGGRDHSTVIHALQTVQEQSSLDQHFKSDVNLIKKKINLRS